MTRRTHAPRVAFVRLGKRVLRYLVGTPSMKIHTKRTMEYALVLSAYAAADYGGQGTDRKSISAAAIHPNGLIVITYMYHRSHHQISRPCSLRSSKA
jgi:hypothetical protein